MKFQITIIGAGVVGLAIANELSKYYNDILLIEKWGHFGEETSSRNSEVIHAGIYYPKDSLKAKLCVSGNETLYSYCDKFSIPFKKCGKLIVACTEDDLNSINKIYNNANDLGARDLKILSKNETLSLEPNIKAEASILSPSTGIIDSHSLMQSLEANSLNNGVDFIYNHGVIEISKNQNWLLKVKSIDDDIFDIETEILINSAGLNSDKIAEMAGIDIDEYHYRLHYAKGHYFKLSSSKSGLVSKLIYPIPNKNITGLGIHVTKDLGDGIKLGPDVQYLQNNKIDYDFNENLKEDFYLSVSRYLKGITINDLVPDYTGIRPKLQKEGESQRDFIIKKESDKSFENLINLIGIESPGLTSSLEIAKYVKNLI